MHNPSLFRCYLAMLSRYLKPQWFQVLMIAVTLLIASGQKLITPQITRNFIDAAIHRRDPLLLLVLALSSIGVAILGQVFLVVSTYFSQNVAWRATNKMRSDLIEHCLSLDMNFHKAHPPGEMIERIDRDVAKLSNFFSQLMFNLLGHAIALVATLVLLSMLAWFIGATVTLFVIIAFVFLTVLRRRSILLWEQDRQANADLASFLGERIEGMEDIRANGAIAYTMHYFRSLLGQRWFITLRSTRVAQVQSMGLLCLLRCASLVALAQGAYLWSIHLATLGTIYLIASYTSQLIVPIEQLHDQFQNVQQVEACIKRINQLLVNSSLQQDGPGCTFSCGPLSVEFENVTFGYDAGKSILRNITFQIQPGKVLGLLGHTGSGKTTIARLLLRLYNPQSGEIRIDGKPIQQAKLCDLRQHIGIVTQDVQLFNASVRDNLTFFDRSIPDERILEALDDVGLLFWYHRLPDGLDTVLSSGGKELSAGEAQLLAFTRILLTDPRIVILDEASARLDPDSEALIERAMDKLLCNRTAIIITHRLRTIQRADDIMLIEGGSMQEYGARTVLAHDPTSRFWHLLQASLEDVLV